MPTIQLPANFPRDGRIHAAPLPRIPLHQEQASEILEAGSDREAIERIRQKYASLRNLLFPGWRQRYDAEMNRRTSSRRPTTPEVA